MKLSKIIYGSLALTIALFASCKEDDDALKSSDTDPKNIAEILTENSALSKLSGALKQVGLDSVLRTTSSFTVFAPTNTAFGALDLGTLAAPELENVLLNHVFQTVTADFKANMTTGYRKTMATGPEDTNLSFFTDTAGDFRFNGVASFVDKAFDIGATNGIVHQVDAPLMPPTVVDHVLANPNYSTLVAALQLAGLVETLQDTDPESELQPFTIFAPDNAAFEALMAQLNGAFGWAQLTDIPKETLTAVLQYHVITGANVVAAAADGTAPSTLQGESFAISGTVIDDATNTDSGIAVADIQGINGVIHGIDRVLLPNAVFQSVLGATLNMVDRAKDSGFTTFLEAVEKAGLTEALATGDLTAFAPNNDAFDALFAKITNYSSLADFDTPEDLAALKELLNYHLHSGALMASDLVDGEEITTLYEDALTIDLSGDTPKLIPSFADANPAKVVAANIGASNGILHEINTILIPDGLSGALGIEMAEGGVCPVSDPSLVFFDWDDNAPWWGKVTAENDPALSLDGSSYGRIMDTTKKTGWFELFFRNGGTLNGGATVGSNISEYSLKFDINVIEPLTTGVFKIVFKIKGGKEVVYDWQPWNDTGEPFTTDGWETIEIPLTLIGVEDYSLIDFDFGMAFQDADVLLNFAMDNVRFDTPGCGGPEPVEDPSLVFFDWDDNAPWWGKVTAENDPAISLDGSNYGRIMDTTKKTGWFELFFRNEDTLNGGATVGSNITEYSLKFDINVLEPIAEGTFKIVFKIAGGKEVIYDWRPWEDAGEPFTTDGWETIKIPLTLIGVEDYSLIDSDFGMAFQDADILLNFAIDNVRFGAL